MLRKNWFIICIGQQPSGFFLWEKHSAKPKTILILETRNDLRTTSIKSFKSCFVGTENKFGLVPQKKNAVSKYQTQ